jgi:hypothetical protein
MCVGLDHLLSHNVLKNAQDLELARKQYVRAILKRQEFMWKHITWLKFPWKDLILIGKEIPVPAMMKEIFEFE